jgi:serine protease
MSGRYRLIGVHVLVLAAVVVALASSSRFIHAQSEASTSPYPMILTAARADAYMEAAARNLDYLPGEVVVKFRSGVTAAGRQRALMALRSRPSTDQLAWVGDDTAVLRDDLELDASILSAQLSSQPEVAYAEPNYLYHFTSSPNDPGFSLRQWNLAALDLPRAWDINPGATSNIVVAIVDSGITEIAPQNFTFPTWNGRAIQAVSVPFGPNPDLIRNRLVNPRDFAFWSGPVLDLVGHGTHVSSTIGEDTNNGLAEAGIAYNVKIMPVKVCIGYWELQFVRSAAGVSGFNPVTSAGGCSNSAVAQGIRYAADNGANVINLSLGGPQPSTTVREALVYAVGKGVFVAISGGNAFENGNPKEYPAAYAAEINGVMGVGAVGRSLKRSYYSSTGDYIEIVAPGGDDSDGGVNGLIWQATLLSSDSNVFSVIFPRFDRYAETPEEGTSMAAPHVAGVAALIMSQGVTNPAAVEALIKATAKDLGPPGRDNEYGYGLIQPRAALRGFGVR